MSKIVSYLTLAFFVVSILSGFVLLFVYHPSMAFNSVQKMVYMIPYGDFFRRLHYFSSELFFIFVIFHIGLELYKKDVRITIGSWNFSIFGFLIVIFLLFSGFILKGDLNAKSAAEVTFTLVKNTPLLDKILPLIKDDTIFYYKFFIWHILFLPLLLIYSIYKHIGYIAAKSEYVLISIGASLLCFYLFKMPLDIPPYSKTTTVSSPWFFLGAENLLRYGFSSIFVVVTLTLPIVLLYIYRITKHKLAIYTALMLWLLSYIFVSIVKL